MKIGPVITDPEPYRRGKWKELLCEMKAGEARKVEGAPRELRNARKNAHWAATELGYVVRTVTKGSEMTIYRSA